MKERGIAATITLALSFVLAFSFALAIPLGASPRLSWRENFESADVKKSLEGEDESGICAIVGGDCEIRVKKSQSGFLLFEHEFDRGQGFRVEARMRQDGSGAKPYVALAWDMVDAENCAIFVLRADGQFAIMKSLKGRYETLSGWQSHPAVSAKAFNLLSVERSGTSLLFAINGTEVKRLPYQSLGGKAVAVMYGEEQTITVDHVRIFSERPWSGDTIEPAKGYRIRHGGALDRSSGAWLQSASGHFTGAWDDSGAVSGNSSGAPEPGYTLANDKRGALGSITRTFDFDLSRDFAILAQVKLLSGDQNYGYGIVVDKSGDRFLHFAVSGDGNFSINRYSGGTQTKIVPWTKSPNVELLESANTLGVFRRRDRLLFSVNGRKVHEMPYDDWISTDIGFCAAGAMKIRPTQFHIVEEPTPQGPVAGDCTDGFGVFDYADGSRHAGYWASGKPQGAGTRYGADGSIRDGWWESGTFSGPAPVPSLLLYPVFRASGDAGLVDASGTELGFGLKGMLTAGKPVEPPGIFASEEGGFGFVDSEGRRQSSPLWTLASTFHEGLAIVRYQGGATGVMNARGKTVIPQGSLDLDPSDFYSGGVIPFHATVDKKTLYGLAGADGTILRKADLESFRPFSEGLAVVKAKNGLFGYLDRSGNWRIPPRYKKASDFSGGFASCTIAGRDFRIDTSGREVPAFGEVGPSSPGLAATRKDGAWGYIDRSGVWAVNPTFAEAMPFRSEGLAQVKTKGGWWTWILPSGEPIWREIGHANLVLREEFSDNSRKWPAGKSASMEALIQKGHYLIITSTDNGDFAGIPLPVDRDSDHAIAALMRYNSKSATESVGLVWDLKDGANFLLFAITPQGGYAVFRFREGVNTPLVDWIADPAVKRGIADNLVEVRREGGDLVFLVNDVVVKTLPWETCSGGAVGFACLGKTSVVVESLSIWGADSRTP